MIVPILKTIAGAVANAARPAATKMVMAGLRDLQKRVASNQAKVSPPVMPPAALLPLSRAARAEIRSVIQAHPTLYHAIPDLETALIRCRDSAAELFELSQTALQVLDALDCRTVETTPPPQTAPPRPASPVVPPHPPAHA